MTEPKAIKVIEDEGGISDIKSLSTEERDLFFERLSNENKTIPKYHFDSFSELLADQIKYENRHLKPDLKELLLRKVIQLSQGVRSQFNITVIPVIPNFAVSLLRKQENGAPAAATPKSAATGGAMPRRRAELLTKVKPKEGPPGGVRVRFDSEVLSVTTAGLDYIVPPNEEMDVIGLVVTPICEQPNTLRDEKTLRKLTSILPADIDIRDRFLIGAYNARMISSECNRFFYPPNYNINIGGEVFSSTFTLFFRDMDEAQLGKTLSALFEYLAGLDAFHRSWESAIGIYNQVSIVTKDPNSGQVLPELSTLMKELIRPMTPIPVTLPEGEKTLALSKLEGSTGAAFTTVNLLALLADLDARGLLRAYYRALAKGVDDPMVKQAIDFNETRKRRFAFEQEVKNKILAETTLLNSYKQIIERKIGAQRLAEIEQQIALKPALVTRAVNILDLLKPQERKLVELEHERREKFIAAVLNNKCPHVKLYRQLRTATTDDRIKKYFDDLKKFFVAGKQKQDEMIKCSNCGFDIICPHVRDMIELDLQQVTSAEMKARLTKYIDKTPIRDQYFCRICGEVIASTEIFGDVSQRDQSFTMSDELRTFMWGEMIQVAKYMKFGQLVSVPQLINTAREAIYPFIFEIEKQILKSKTNSADEIKNKKRLFITLYTFAYMIHLIMSNKGRKGELDISFRNFKPKDPKKLIVELVAHALSIIVMSKNIIIREIPGMTNDIIKQKLIEAFKAVSSQGVQVIEYSSESENLLTTLVLDPVYRYLYSMNVMDDMLSGKKPGKSKYDLVDKIETYLGATVAQLEKSDDVFGKMKGPRLDARWRVNEFNSLKPLHAGVYAHGGKFIYADAYLGYAARSWEHFSRRISHRMFNEYVYADAGSRDTIETKFREYYQKFTDDARALADKEELLMRYRAFEYAKNFNQSAHHGNRRLVIPEVPLGRIYDEDGNDHKWDVLLYVDGKETKEMNVKDIPKQTEAGTPFTAKIVDKKCTVCGGLWSSVDKFDEAKIVEALNVKNTISNFFRFYENRCPKGALHTVEKDKCSKCGLVLNMLIDVKSKDALAYYREYRANYKREREEFIGADASGMKFPEPKPVIDLATKYDNEYAKWTFNFNSVLDLSHKLKISQWELVSLGAKEKIEYSEILAGKYVPPEATQRHDTRIYVISGHIKNLITEYNMLKWFHQLGKPPMDLVKLVDASGINKHKMGELHKKLPNIYNEFNARLDYFKRHKKPREIVSFCIQTFCEMCLLVWNDTDKETERLRRDFVEYIVKKILRMEEMLTKPGYFNWALIYGEKETKEKDTYDSNYNPDVDKEVDEHEIESEEKDATYGDTGKPLSTDDLDVDIDPDKDDDDDDDPYDMKVGEDYGLD